MPKFEDKVCVIVDAYSTGRFLTPMLSGYGYSCVHVQSMQHQPAMFSRSFKPEYFLENIIHEGDISVTLERLKKYQVKFLVPGAESGVILAEQLAHEMKLPVNDISLNKARRNKFAMTDAVNKSGIKTVDYCCANNVEEILVWARRLNKYPYVIKPTESAGGDNVHFCNNESEIRTAFLAVMDAKNIFGDKNVEVIAQTFATGQEYVVNTINLSGASFVTDVWRVNKKTGTAAYDTCELVRVEDPVYSKLVPYTKSVLNALGVSHGAAHTELKYDEREDSPVLIESAARLMGAAELSFATEIYGYNQASIMLEAYLNPDEFMLRVERGPKDKVKYGLNVLLMSDFDGVLVKNLPIEDKLRSLKTIHSYNVYVRQGDSIAKTIDMATCPGTIYLIGDSKDEVWRDYQQIRAAEKGLYESAVGRSLDQKAEFSNDSNQQSASREKQRASSWLSSKSAKYTIATFVAVIGVGIGGRLLMNRSGNASLSAAAGNTPTLTG